MCWELGVMGSEIQKGENFVVTAKPNAEGVTRTTR